MAKLLIVRAPKDARATVVELDGHDIANAISGFALDADSSPYGPGWRLRLEVPVIEATTVDVENVQAYIPPATEELLIRLGWTPPQAEPVEVRTEVKLDGKAIYEEMQRHKRQKGLE